MRPEQIETTIRQVVAKHIDPDRSLVFLFGSRAGRQSRVSSDYDVGLYEGAPISLMRIAKIKDELEDYPLPVHVDIVDFATVSEGFKKLALTTVKVWNQPKSGFTLT